jgi:hypothetical protein
LAALLAIAGAPIPARACGYHDDVTIARVGLNLSYPDALHVLGAVASAVMQGRLQPPAAQVRGPDLLGVRYRATVTSLETLGEEMRAAPGDQAPTPVSLVLIEPMLWTRFVTVSGEERTTIHMTGPQRGDLVVVAGEGAIGEIARGKMSVGEAHSLGLIRLYGSEEQITGFLARYAAVGTAQGGEEETVHLDRAH